LAAGGEVVAASARAVTAGRGSEHAEVAVAVNSRRRHQGGEAVEQLERRQEQRAAAAGARFRVVVDGVLAVELA
jgi:hypothetical protein